MSLIVRSFNSQIKPKFNVNKRGKRCSSHINPIFVCCHHTDYCQSIECSDDTYCPEKMKENGKLNSLTSTSSLTFRDEIHKNRNHFHRACVAPNPPIGRQNIITCRSISRVGNSRLATRLAARLKSQQSGCLFVSVSWG